MSRTATISSVIAMLALAAVVLGPLGVQIGALSPLTAFYVFALGIPGSLLGLVFGIIGLLRTRAGAGRDGRERATLGTALSGLLILAFGYLAGSAGGSPAIHDVTTDVEDPPAFSEAVANAPGRRNGVAYPDGGPDVPKQQRVAFPDLAPIELAAPPDEAFDRALRAAEALGWAIARREPERGVFEATDTTAIFRFVDDVVVRVRPRGSGSVVDVRSNSRVGRGDIGANAARIEAFRAELLGTQAGN